MTIADRRARGIAPVHGGGRTGLGPVGSGRAKSADTARRLRAARSDTASTPAGAEIAPQTLDPNWQPQASFEQNFVVHYPLQQVWDFFGRIEEVATCLPGASIKQASLERASGQIRVKLGPISAEFRGIAQIERDAATHSGRIQGAGSDARSNSATRGDLRYRLIAVGDNSTRVEVTIAYRLTGMLAQFGRAGLVQDVAARLTAAFAQNVEARLSGAAPAAAGETLSFGALIGPMLVARVREVWQRLFRGRA